MKTAEWKDQIALVTGAGGTMGIASTVGLLKEGARVAMTDLNDAILEKALSKVEAQLGRKLTVRGAADKTSDPAGNRAEVFLIGLDVTKHQQCHEAVAAIQRSFGDITILVNNAGILSNNKAEQTSEEEWHKVFAVNLDSAFYLSQAVLPSMRKKKWGRIINTCSFAAKSGGITAGTAYSVSKAAMVGLTFSLAAETTGDGITVNGIAPAYVKTPMVTEQLSPEQQQKVMAKIPVGRYCEPEEFAHVVTFLASPLAGFITGEIVDQNGGLQFD